MIPLYLIKRWYLRVGILSSRDSGLQARASTRKSWWKARRTLNSTPSTSMSSSCRATFGVIKVTTKKKTSKLCCVNLCQKPGKGRWPPPQTGSHHRPGGRPRSLSWKDWILPHGHNRHTAPYRRDCEQIPPACLSLSHNRKKGNRFLFLFIFTKQKEIQAWKK